MLIDADSEFTGTLQEAGLMSITPLLGWRDYLFTHPDRVRGDSDYYLSRAQELRETVATVLAAGLSEGAQRALTDLAEEDSVDFCIMADLAGGVQIPGVDRLEPDDASHLQQFLHEEPWRSLEVDNEIAVCIAMLRAYGENAEETIWHESDPHLLKSISQAFGGVNGEQLGRFVAEINALGSKRHAGFDAELKALAIVCAEMAALRLGVQRPILFN